MAGGYPNLFPSYFIEYEDNPCSGPSLYRSQPSREQSYAPTLNDFMNKYITSDTTALTTTNVLTYLSYLNKHWNKIPSGARKEVLELLKESNSPLGRSLNGNGNGNGKRIESFTNETNVKESNSLYSMFTLIIVAIVAMVLGYLMSIVMMNT